MKTKKQKQYRLSHYGMYKSCCEAHSRDAELAEHCGDCEYLRQIWACVRGENICYSCLEVLYANS